MPTGRPIRTLEDLDRAIRAIASEFKTDKVFVIGSQAILLSWPDAPTEMKASPEIDAFPDNAKIWEIEEEARHPGTSPEASEHIYGLFGMGSQFHQTHGFYIDGVDENTAKLPAGWTARAVVRRIDVGDRRVLAVAPSPEDLIVSKLARLEEKDKIFIETYHSARPLDPNLIEERIRQSDLLPEIADKAIAYIHELARR
ncbi:MAG: hypothetical protein K2Y71_23390 [Xanthobacteraceae bacterium]|nr:hypothetical protein [Xanthobacteraceae bacterium]